MIKELHIVTLAVPYPVIHGGMTDLYQKLTALYEAGVLIHLHCFSKDGRVAPELLRFCRSVHYYRRTGPWKALSISLPFIVASRRSEELARRLLADDLPILLEGIHCSWILNDNRFIRRRIFLRLHNVEHRYYHALFRCSDSFRRLYYFYESFLLLNYEKKIAKRPAHIFTVSKRDLEYYKKQFGAERISFLPVFLPEQQLMASGPAGTYCLYHGNLAVDENQKAAIWLTKEVFGDSEIPLIIAGRRPSKKLLNSVSQHKNIRVISDPSEEQMQELLMNARVHVIPSFNSTGVKLKLINALYSGRHCVVNRDCAEGSELESLCHIADDPNDFRRLVSALFSGGAELADITERKKMLDTVFDRATTAQQLILTIW